MIGSDWPVCLVAASYAQTIEVVKSYVFRPNQNLKMANLAATRKGFGD
jgi:predicted TIM-barrel fold metal-dependent hydrolase